MWDDIQLKLTHRIEELKIRVKTLYRKVQIRHAYHPIKNLTPFLFTLIFTVVIALVALFVYFKYDWHTTQIAETSSVEKEDTITSGDEIDQTGDYFLAPFPAMPGQEEMEFMLVADKYDRVIHLLKCQKGIWGVIKSYPVAIGEVLGRKFEEGDKMTPEGTYIIINRYFPDDIERVFNSSSAIYGPMAYVLNYPNRHDVIAGRTGSGIWIHGTVDGKVPVDTKGCLEMHNNNIGKLEKFIGDGDLIPVIIHNNPTFNLEKDIDLNEVWSEREFVKQERTPEPIENSFKVTSSNVVDTIEDTTNSSENVSIKIDSTIFDSANHKTVSESSSTDTVIEAQVTGVTEANSFSDDSLLIVQRINQWKSDWESADIDKYERNYAKSLFSSGSYNWTKWRAKKIRTFKNYSTIIVTVSDLHVTSISRDKASATFFQKYQSDLFHAENNKRIVLQKVGGNWKIVQELTVRL